MAVINTNIPALTAERNLNATQNSIFKSIQQLSSGLRINSAADDAAGLSISEKLRAQINGTKQAIQNVQDGISMMQTAEGALNEVHAILQRMRELGVEAANGDLNVDDRNAIQLEITQLNASMDKISSNTQFNGLNLLTGQLAVTFSTGGITSGTVGMTVSTVDLSGTKPNSSYSLTVCTSLSTATYAGGGVTQTIQIRDMTTSDAQVLNFDRVGIRFEVQSGLNALSATQVLDQLVSNNDLVHTGTSSNFTTNAQNGTVSLQIGSNASASDQFQLNFVEVDSATLGLASANATTVTGAQNLITALDNAISTVSTRRATLGAQENALQSTASNLTVASENLTASESRIRDLDVAAATVQFTKEQILQQAGTAVLAQANSLPQSVLQLLK